MKLGVCVPYRNRELHLNEFVPKVSKYLKNQGIDFHMYFGHQVDDKLFNRGAMKNVAAKHAFEDGCDYIVWHDIDIIKSFIFGVLIGSVLTAAAYIFFLHM